MELPNEQMQQLRQFESLMYNKGYRQHFSYGRVDSSRPLHMQSLSSILHDYLEHTQRTSSSKDEFYLFTYAEYLSAEDFKQCRFKIDFDPQNGFLISQLTIESEAPKETKRLSFRHNNEVPGKKAVIGRFRKPKPWDRTPRDVPRHKKRW